MNYLLELVDPAAHDVEPQWLVTDETTRSAEALTADLNTMGYEATVQTVSGDGGDYLEVRVGPSSEYLRVLLMVAGGAVEADDSDDPDEQREHETFLTVLRAAERITGLRADPDGEAELLLNARECGVGPGGEITTTRTITDDQLSQSMIALAQRSLPAPELPRPPLLLHSAALDELLQLIQSVVPPAQTPWRARYLPSPGGYSTVSDTDAPDPLEQVALQHMKLGFRLHAELGDDSTGRPVEIDIVLSADRIARATIRFDTLPGFGAPFFEHGAPWESEIRAFAARDPDWIPAWAQEAIDLFRAAGRDFSPELSTPTAGTSDDDEDPSLTPDREPPDTDPAAANLRARLRRIFRRS